MNVQVLNNYRINSSKIKKEEFYLKTFNNLSIFMKCENIPNFDNLERFGHFKNIFEHLIQISPRPPSLPREQLKPLPKLNLPDEAQGHLTTLHKNGIDTMGSWANPLAIAKVRFLYLYCCLQKKNYSKFLDCFSR